MEKINVKAKGVFHLLLKDVNGNVLKELSMENDITDAGFDFLCDVLGDSPQPGEMNYIGIGWGTGANTAFNAAQTDLQGASTDRNAAVYSHSAGTKTLTLTASWGFNDPVAGTVPIEEIGIFNASSGGTMFNRLVIPELNKTATATLEIEWTITFS